MKGTCQFDGEKTEQKCRTRCRFHQKYRNNTTTAI